MGLVELNGYSSTHKLNMKIGILGAGTAAIVAICEILDTVGNNNFLNLNIDIIYDPTIPTIEVGESLSPPNFVMLKRVLGIENTKDLRSFQGTHRYYTKLFFNDNDKNFSVYYITPGAHLNSQTLSKNALNIILKKYGMVNEVHDKILLVEQNEESVKVTGNKAFYKYDYVIYCTGSPSEKELASSEYSPPSIETVNSVILYPEFKNFDENHTSAYMHKNGWMFGVPLPHRKAWGYLYNNKITSKTEAIEHFSEIKNIDASTLRNFSWEPYYRKKVMDGRILYLGNKLYLFEPHGALPLYYYANLIKVFNKNVDKMTVENLIFFMNNYHKKHMEAIEDLIAINYYGDVYKDYDSPFWNYIKPKAYQQLKQSENWCNWVKKVKKENVMSNYFFHDDIIMDDYINGYKINLDNFC